MSQRPASPTSDHYVPPAARWGAPSNVRLRGGTAHQHRRWAPVFTQLTTRPGTWACIYEGRSVHSARSCLRALQRYLPRARGASAEFFQLHRQEENIYCRYVPPSVQARWVRTPATPEPR